MNENIIRHTFFLWNGILVTPEGLKEIRESEE